jgi:hypothetical protein
LRIDEFSRFSIQVRQGLFDDPLKGFKCCHGCPRLRWEKDRPSQMQGEIERTSPRASVCWLLCAGKVLI